MIYVKGSEIPESEFVDFLGKIRDKLLSDKSKLVKIEPSAFEELVFESARFLSKGTRFEGGVEYTPGSTAFPDIVVREYYGVEVKTTNSNKWISMGNSVLESTRRPEVEIIYIFLGKLGKDPDVRFRRYEECLERIVVTHSPRYHINLELNSGESIFDKMKMTYNEFRKTPNPIVVFIEFFRKNILKSGEEVWWAAEQGSSPIVRAYRTLSADERRKLFIDTMILFPEIYGPDKSDKYERIGLYLTSLQISCPNVRDPYSAGGIEIIKVKDLDISVPQVYFNLCESAKEIRKGLADLPEQELMKYWGVPAGERLKTWKDLINEQFLRRDDMKPYLKQGILLSDIFDTGLM